MAGFASLLLSFALAISQSLVAADRTLVAEGDCIARTKTGDKLLSHWQLWHLRNGDYEVVDASITNASSVQIFRFDSKFLPTGYTKKFGSFSMPEIPNAPALSGRKFPGHTISCQYESTELRCDSESSEGHKSTASIAAKQPYVFIGEFYDLDFVWFMTGVARLASRDGATDGVVNVYAMTDGANHSGIALKPDMPLKIIYSGEETTQLMGKTEVVKKYKWGSKVLRVTAEGLPVSLMIMGSNELGYVMSGYKEYAQWGPAR